MKKKPEIIEEAYRAGEERAKQHMSMYDFEMSQGLRDPNDQEGIGLHEFVQDHDLGPDFLDGIIRTYRNYSDVPYSWWPSDDERIRILESVRAYRTISSQDTYQFVIPIARARNPEDEGKPAIIVVRGGEARARRKQ